MDHRDRMQKQGGWLGVFCSGTKFNSDQMLILVPVEAFMDLCHDDSEEEFECATMTPLYKEMEKISFEMDETLYLPFPCQMQVCGTCDGKGKHVNPSIDSHGISAAEWEEDWDEDDRDDYIGGLYDVTCYECHGANVVPTLVPIDETKDPLRARILKFMEECAECRAGCDAESEMERRMGA